MKAVIKPSTAKGSVKVPPSKSMAHRHIICAALSEGVSNITNVDFSEDILATLDCIASLGAQVVKKETSVSITGVSIDSINKQVDFYCRESGSTMRFFMGIAMCLGINGRFYGSETLRNRPFGIYEDLCRDNNILFSREADSIVIKGQLINSEFNIPGNVSSQFITGLLFALPLLNRKCRINLIPPIESRSYLNLTIKAMQDAKVLVSWEDSISLSFEANQRYKNIDIAVEGDYSNAAFLDAFNYAKGNVTVLGLKEDSLQGDRVYKGLFKLLMEEEPTIDISDCPDLGPILFCVAASHNGALFTGTRRLKMKESDRGLVMCQELSKLGINTQMDENSIRIGTLNSESYSLEPEICGHNDHRIVMSFSYLLSICGGSITEAMAVRKSYPGFFDDIKALGIDVNLMED